MNPPEPASEDASMEFRWNLFHDDSVRLFETSRFLLGALITVSVFLAAQIWL